jgi:hypothetical protein
MKYQIPQDVLDWSQIDDEKFIEMYALGDRDKLMMSYLFHNDVPFRLAGCVHSKTRPENLTSIFAKNAELGLTIPNSDIRVLYSIEGLQQQFNEAVRMQYYYKDEMMGNTIGCYMYYIEAHAEGQKVTRELKNLPLVVDPSYVRRERLINDLIKKFEGIENAAAAIYWVVDESGNPPDSRYVIARYIKSELHQRFSNIKRTNPVG